MNTVGIIAEYDPFHNGHAWQLAEVRARGAQHIIVCLSNAFTQRGAPALLPQRVRVSAALENGADMVLSLPAPYACSGAEQFAAAGVAILCAAGCDTLAFGAETPNTELLMQTARALLSEEYRMALAEQLADVAAARNFATARQRAIEICAGAQCAALLANPNDNLAVEYCKAIITQHAAITPMAMPRVGANHGETLGAAAHYASGSALRKLFLTQGISAIEPYVRPSAFILYHKASEAGEYTAPAHLDFALLSRLRAAQPGGFAAVRGVREGLEYRLADAVRTASSAESLADALTTARYPRARMRRLCADAALGIMAGAVPALPPYIHVLGGKQRALGILKHARLPVSTSLAKLAAQNEACRAVAQMQAAASDFVALCRATPSPMGEAFTDTAVIVRTSEH